MKILVLGATGLLGNAVFRVLSELGNHSVFGTIRNFESRKVFISELSNQLQVVDDLRDEGQIIKLLNTINPDVIVNCTSLSKELHSDPMQVMSFFSVLPRRLAHLCRLRQVRLIQIGTDCVFSGSRGGYTEDDLTDATDPYGTAKFLGEVEGRGMITLRTSMIGPAIFSRNGLLDWFLSQKGECIGYKKAIFSGFPTVVLAQIIRDVILPRPELEGIFHLATSPISKFDLLHLIAQRYNHSTHVVPDDKFVIDRSLSAARFKRITGYVAPEWPKLIDTMYSYKFGLKEN